MNKLEAIILKVQPYQESSRLIQTFTKLGKVSLIARGSQKVNSDLRVLSQYLTHISFEYKSFKTMLPIINGKIINDFKIIKTNYEQTKYASLILELVNKLYIDEQYYEPIYNLMIESLNYEDILLSSLSFAIKLTYYLGYGLDLKGNGNKIKGLSTQKGGVVYENEDYFLDANVEETLELLKLTYLKTNNLNELKNININKVKDFIYKYYLTVIEINLKTLL